MKIRLQTATVALNNQDRFVNKEYLKSPLTAKPITIAINCFTIVMFPKKKFPVALLDFKEKKICETNIKNNN